MKKLLGIFAVPVRALRVVLLATDPAALGAATISTSASASACTASSASAPACSSSPAASTCRSAPSSACARCVLAMLAARCDYHGRRSRSPPCWPCCIARRAHRAVQRPARHQAARAGVRRDAVRPVHLSRRCALADRTIKIPGIGDAACRAAATSSTARFSACPGHLWLLAGAVAVATVFSALQRSTADISSPSAATNRRPATPASPPTSTRSSPTSSVRRSRRSTP